ncbi:MAG: alpha/beta fold hydrolase [Bacteroidales bacterium]|nr:alpha/beta fold hydrolase [Bacteroidales bacterium]
MDFNIKLSNGQVLKGIIKSPGEDLKAVIILIHGLGEHIQRYDLWAELFNQEGIGFTGVDLPGHGRSGGRRGSIKSYDLLREMIDILLNSCKQTFPGVPIFMYGHSLGGGIVLDYLIRRNPVIKGAIITSPWLRLTFEPSKFKLVMASIMKNILPGLIQPSGLVVNHISHDEAVIERYKADPLVHNKISVALFVGAETSASYSLTHGSELKVPTLLLHGRDDLITSPESSIEFAEQTDMVEIKLWDNGYHELHNEIFKNEVFTYIASWIKKKLI